jgi:hypothetical protein
MIEGAGLGSYTPAEIGPIDVQYANGVVDLRVADDAAAVRAAKRYLSYFRRASPEGAEGPPKSQSGTEPPSDQTKLPELIPANRKRVYAIREVIATLLDDVLELRGGFGAGMVTALARLEGAPLGVIGNDPSHLGGAIDAPAADKAAASCSCATPSGRRFCSLPTPRASWPDPRPRRPERSGTSAACSSPAPISRCRRGPWYCARATGWGPGDGRRQLQSAVVHHRLAHG